MFRDECRDKVWSEVRQLDLRAFAKILTPEVFALAAVQAGVRVGQSALNLVNLVWLGISAARQQSVSFATILVTTLRILEDQREFESSVIGRAKRQGQRTIKRQKMQGKKRPKSTRKKKGKKPPARSKHDPRRLDPTQLTEEAFAQARQRMPLAFWLVLLLILAERFQLQHPEHCTYRGFRLLAMDGTTFNLPRSEKLRAHYGVPKSGKRKNKQAAPQARMVLLMLPGARIPIAYEFAPLANSELTLAARLLQHVRANDLLLMDRGFISYGLFWQVQSRGAFFGTRLKKGLNLRKIKQLGPGDKLVEWTPKDSRRQWRHLPRSLQLRVIDYQFPGFRRSAVITNVLDPKRLSRDEWVRMARDYDDNGKFTSGLYHRRWQIETGFAELKVVMNMKHLRSRTRASLEYEVAGCLLYYLLVRWLIAAAAREHGLDPLRLSFTNAVRELETMRSALVTADEEWARETLLPRLLARIAAHQIPWRPGRHYPRPNDTHPKNRGHGRKQLPAKLNKKINTRRATTAVPMPQLA